MPSFTLTTDVVTTVESNDLEVDGEDISVRGGQFTESVKGDLLTVTKDALVRQSIHREIPANPGSFARRPEWGGGLSGMLFRGASIAVRDQIQAQAKTRLLANPRVKQVQEVSTTLVDGKLRLAIRCASIFGNVDETIVVKPPGVS